MKYTICLLLALILGICESVAQDFSFVPFENIAQTLQELDVPRSTFYDWYQRYQEEGFDGLADKKPGPQQFWNRIPESVKEQVVELALEHPEKSSRQLAWQFTDKNGYIRAFTAF